MSVLRRMVAGLLFCFIFLTASFAPACASEEPSVMKEDVNPLSTRLHLPVYIWQAQGMTPRAVVVTIHGVTLHGAVYEKLACSLAQSGYLVVSPDLRGFGRWYLGADQYVLNGGVSFYKSRADLVRLLSAIKEQYAGLPIFCIGESLGANLAVWLASTYPDYLNGIILSSPCVKRKLDICSTMIVDTLKAPFNRNRQVPIAPYAKRYLSENPLIIEAYLNDPLMRKTMTVYESLQSLHTARSTLWFIDEIPANMPVLAIEGSKDRMFDPKAAEELFHKIKVNDGKFCWLNNKGHIHLETPHVSPEVLETITNWLAEHSLAVVGQKVSNKVSDAVVSDNPSLVLPEQQN